MSFVGDRYAVMELEKMHFRPLFKHHILRTSEDPKIRLFNPKKK